MANGNQLPSGFVLDQPQQGVPEGFQLDQPQEGSLLPSVAEIDEAIRKIPGVPALAELGAGVGRSVGSIIDFFGSDTLNAALELAGSDKRVPTARSLAAPKGSFTEPGLIQDIASGVGELIPAATGIGAALRARAAALPAQQAAEGAITGIQRQLGATRAGQDVAGAALSATGGAVGKELGGEEGEIIGSIAAPIAAAAVPIRSAKKVASNLIKQSAPTVDQLKQTARGIYSSIGESGFKIPSSQFDNLADDIVTTMKKEGFDPDLTPRVNAIIRRFSESKGQNQSLSDIDLLRQIARNTGDSAVASERRLSQIAVEKVDNFLDGLGGKVGDRETGQAFRAARDLWQRARKVEILDNAVIEAQNQASGFENGLRRQFASISKRIRSGKLKGFTKQEHEAIDKVVQGTIAGNVAKMLGKFGIMDGVTSRTLTTLGGAGLTGASTGSTAAAVAVPGIGQLSGALAQRMTANNAAMATSVIRAGKNNRKIIQAYLKNTTKQNRSPEELAELFLANKVPIENISTKSANQLVSSAAIIASLARINDKKEGEQ